MNTLKPEKKNLKSDLLAGLTFALVNIPQAMAHALLASVNPVLGLYTLMLAIPFGALFTSSTFLNVSTTSALSVAAGGVMISYPVEARTSALVTLVLLIGIFQLALGLLRLGWVTRFISLAVMTGFMTGVAVMIIIGQLGDFTGYYSSYSGKIFQLADLVLHWKSFAWATFAIGLLTIILIYVLDSSTRLSKFSLVLALLLASGAAALLNQYLTTNIKLVGDVASVPHSLPKLVLPDLKLIPALLVPAISLGIIGLVQGAGVSQTFPNPDGNFSNVSRDFFGQGIANLASGFFGGIPAGGSSSGTALIVSAGARSRWANIFAGLLVALGVLLFANLVEMVAMPALAGLVIVAGVRMINVNTIQTVWQTNVFSRAIMLVTFASTLIMPLQFAVFVGVGISILLFVFQQSNILRIVEWEIRDGGWPVEQPAPKQLESNKVTVLFTYGSLFYAAADKFEKELPVATGSRQAVVILLLRGYEELGSTVLEALRRYTESLHANNGKLIVAGVSVAMQNQFQRTGMLRVIGQENIFPMSDNIGESGNAALHAAREWLADQHTRDE